MTDEDDPPLIDAFSRHEVLHVASIAADFFERHLREHRAVRADPILRERAEAIAEQLADFYQLVGQRTVDDS